jgi:hypothetical protein
MWKSKGIKLALVSLVILTMLLAGGCFNKPPVITSLTPSATEVARGGSCTVNCVATDENTDDTLTYAWSASGGAISGTGSTVTWTAPTTEGSYSVTVTVSDGKESVSDSCNITVANIPPVITSLTPSTTNLPPEGSCTIGCVASDADGDTLTYNWSATGGTVVGTGNSVSWEAPAAEGTYTVSVEVSDGHGGTVSDSVDIVVEMKYGAIDIQSDPAGAAVFLNGVDTGNITPYVITNLSPGTYNVRLEYYHYKHRAQQVTVNPNDTTYINWSLTYAPNETLVLQPNPALGKDTYVYITAPDDNWADREWISAGAGVGDIARLYIQFDLSLLPENAVITNASLGLVYWYTSNAAVAPIGAYAVLGSWTETGVTWNNQPVFATTAEYTINIPAGVTDGFHYWYITDLAKSWWDGSQGNFGVMLKDTDESTEEAWKRFRSSDWTVAHERPKLTITYFDPTS